MILIINSVHDKEYNSYTGIKTISSASDSIRIHLCTVDSSPSDQHLTGMPNYNSNRVSIDI